MMQSTRREFLVYNDWRVIDLSDEQIADIMESKISGLGTIDVTWLNFNKEPFEVWVWPYRIAKVTMPRFGFVGSPKTTYTEGYFTHFLGQTLLLPAEFDNSMEPRRWVNKMAIDYVKRFARLVEKVPTC